jgi:aspartyl aminopeptidase
MKRYTAQDEIKGLMEFIDGAPTPYHGVERLSAMLEDAGAVRLSEEERWDSLYPGMLYYFVRNESCIVAFRLGSRAPEKDGWRITLSHLDYPCLRIRPHTGSNTESYERLSAEVYGGIINHSWFDRPLSLAGRVYTRSGSGNGMKGVNINAARPLLQIPELALHMNHGANDNFKVNTQTELLPFFSQDFDGGNSFTAFIASEAGVEEDELLSYDLSVVEATPCCTLGESGEFLSAPHLDNGEMVYSSFRGFIEASEISEVCSMVIAFDHEEVGSTSDRGARSDLLTSTLRRIHDNIGLDEEDRRRALSQSIVCSADMAHASHPAYPATYEPGHKVYLNKGPVLKHSFSQTYIESPRAAAYFKLLCEEHQIPYQEFVNRNDLRGGSTVGPASAAALGALGFDMGNAIFSMHSVREFGGAMDVFYSTEFFEAFNSR